MPERILHRKKERTTKRNMKTLYFDCGMGAAGDMICAALLELVLDREATLKKLNQIGIPEVEYQAEKKQKQEIAGTSMRVKIHGSQEESDHPAHTHVHMKLEDIQKIIRDLHASDRVKTSVMDIYQIIAQAESQAHNCTVEEVHFHEVGAMDAIADITAACALIEEIGPDVILASPVHVGKGTVACAHGILPVPAPATANILKDIPYYSEDIEGELCTPTGAALLKYFVKSFQTQDVSTAAAVGRGMGKREFQRPSYIAAYLI